MSAVTGCIIDISMLTDPANQNFTLQNIQEGGTSEWKGPTRQVCVHAEGSSVHWRQPVWFCCYMLGCLPHLPEDKLGLEGLALPLGAPDAHDQGHLDLACKTAQLCHVVLCYVELQCMSCVKSQDIW